MAGQSMRDIKRRIASVRNMQQITKAMEMVDAAKLRRAQQRVLAARPFVDKLSHVLARLGESQAAGNAKFQHPLLEQREVQRVGYVAIAADRGLAGGYNANVIRKVQGLLDSETRETGVIAIGRKMRDHFRKTERAMQAEHVFLGDRIEYSASRSIAKQIMDLYVEGVFDEVHLVYNEFISAISQRPVDKKVLPIEGITDEQAQDEDAEEELDEAVEYLYEPSPEAVLNILIPRYVETQVYRALLEAKASEHAARMMAMRSASDNADEMIDSLTLSFNRARQASITKEISEIVGGAEALTT